MSEVINVTKTSLPPMEEYIEEIRDLWDTHWVTNMGVKHNLFRDQLKDLLGVENIELLVNGHMALEMAIQAFDMKGEVITTPFTFASTTHAIVRNGLTPVFCDINPETYLIDENKIEDLITEKTCAILPVHVYGNICNVEKIEEIARKHNLKVIYDAAHCFGETYKGQGVGSFGDASIFSFHATKVFNSIEGGAVSFKLEEIGKRIYNLKNFGINGPEEVNAVGANAKLNEFCAAMGICNLRHFNEKIAARKRLVERYRELLGGVEGIQLNCIQKDVTSNYSYFPAVFDKETFGCTRDDVYEALSEENIVARKYFYPLTNDFSCYEGYEPEKTTPVAYRISNSVLTLPLYPDLGIEAVDKICRVILECKK